MHPALGESKKLVQRLADEFEIIAQKAHGLARCSPACAEPYILFRSSSRTRVCPLRQDRAPLDSVGEPAQDVCPLQFALGHGTWTHECLRPQRKQHGINVMHERFCEEERGRVVGAEAIANAAAVRSEHRAIRDGTVFCPKQAFEIKISKHDAYNQR